MPLTKFFFLRQLLEGICFVPSGTTQPLCDNDTTSWLAEDHIWHLHTKQNPHLGTYWLRWHGSQAHWLCHCLGIHHTPLLARIQSEEELSQRTMTLTCILYISMFVRSEGMQVMTDTNGWWSVCHGDQGMHAHMIIWGNELYSCDSVYVPSICLHL